MKQLSFIRRPNLSCGGSLNNTRHSKRVLSTKRPIHLVLKVKKSHDLFKRRLWVKRLIERQSARFQIKIFASSVQRDHLHLAVQVPSRSAYVQFVRTITGLIARKFGKGIFIFRPFTRVATWGREFRNLMNYLFRNDMEVFKVWSYVPRVRL